MRAVRAVSAVAGFDIRPVSPRPIGSEWRRQRSCCPERSSPVPRGCKVPGIIVTVAAAILPAELRRPRGECKPEEKRALGVDETPFTAKAQRAKKPKTWPR